MNKYAVGDIVRIKKDTTLFTWCPSIAKYAGKLTTIVSVDGSEYCVDIDDMRFLWAEDWLEPVGCPMLGSTLTSYRKTVDLTHDLIALMSKYDIITYNIEQSEGLMTFTFTKEV